MRGLPGPLRHLRRGPVNGPTKWYGVIVEQQDGSTHADGIRGDTPDEAHRNAVDNWITGTPYGKAKTIQVGPEGDGPWE
jgi:hypothetical protein